MSCAVRSSRDYKLVLCPGNSSNNSTPLADARGSMLSAVCTEPRPSGSREHFCPNLWHTTLESKSQPQLNDPSLPRAGHVTEGAGRIIVECRVDTRPLRVIEPIQEISTEIGMEPLPNVVEMERSTFSCPGPRTMPTPALPFTSCGGAANAAVLKY